ncbi:uncharacterized protein LOC123321576 [Coccinella septempunctata]|uniref:uncharacterized protein LOC123321576 n=1 Tax=Coccinella septempunctata TaxID=41139 RepID=UPI001D081917|nr:uncharacterized protein LOC123321576 [Coccinella septempunctata]
MGSIDIKKLVEDIQRLREESDIANEEYSKKEDTYTILNSNIQLIATDCEEQEIGFVHNSCYLCNGYYGSSFGEHLCTTCHLFLYPMFETPDSPTFIPEENSDSDSGNDEPIEASFRLNGNENSEESFQRNQAASSSDVVVPELSIRRRIVIRPYICMVVEHFSPYPERRPRGHILDYSLLPDFKDFKFEGLSPEIFMYTLQYLDTISLWSVSQVSQRWRSIVDLYIKAVEWRNLLQDVWPLLKIRGEPNQDWYKYFTAMMNSACCFNCVYQMTARTLPPNWDNSSWRAHRLMTELRVMKSDPLDGIQAEPLDDCACHWQATLEGPAGSPYEGGLFFLFIKVPESYPLTPPIVRFITKIFHPNVSRHGDIGIDSIHQNWSLALTMSKLLISIQSLLTDPFCDVCMEPDICDLYINNRKAFDKQARKWTAKYAMNDLMAYKINRDDRNE